MAPTSASHVDLLIIGAGPAGLVAAAWASRYKISCRIIDRNASRIATGHADGLQPRTVEILDSFGIAERPLKEGYHVIEICSWNPDSEGRLQRTQRVVSQRPGSSRFQQLAFGQGAIEQIFADFLKADGNIIRVERNVDTQRLQLDETLSTSSDNYPITLDVRHESQERESTRKSGAYANGAFKPDCDRMGQASRPTPREVGRSAGADVETIKAKYLIGCDGAHSWTRTQLGLSLEGESTDHVWGVMDIVPLTDFPDIRLSCAIHSTSSGSLMTVPREDRLVRLYIQLKDVREYQDRSDVTLDLMFQAAQKIIAPYELKYQYCDWWSIYQIGQRVAPKFDVGRRIFLAGDAIHTHSPKAGQGMNVSMQDTYNLSWKICSVLKGLAKPAILDTYQAERRQVAQDLIQVDHEISRFYSVASASQSDFQAFREKFYDFLSGVAVRYDQGPLTHHMPTSKVMRDRVATNIVVGRRLASYQVLNQADAKPTQMADILPSNGRWHILVFAGDLRKPDQLSLVRANGNHILQLVRTYTPRGQAIDEVIEVLTIHSAPRTPINLLDLPDIYHPWDNDRGWDYGKVFVDDVSYHEGFGAAYEKYGIERERGCFVVCRPDQHVGCKGELKDMPMLLNDYFGRLLNKVTSRIR